MTNFTYKDAGGNQHTGRAVSLPVGAPAVDVPVQLVHTGIRTILGYGFAAVTTVAGLPNVPANATHAYVTVESGGGDVRWRSDGGTPTASPSTNANAGLRCPAGSAFEVALADLSQVKVIAVSGTATLNVEYARVDA